MPSDDYTSSTVRGSLKLKGSTPTGVTKTKKKKKSKLLKAIGDEGDESGSLSARRDGEDDDGGESNTKPKAKGKRKGDGEDDEGGEGEDGDGRTGDLSDAQLKELETRDVEGDGKTASERAYEEMRRKRLHDRLQKEGVKTHKQRVEELNKYLSGLSEHHDMPKIGPG